MLNSKDLMVVFFTAENCGHCVHSRGEGILNTKDKVLVSSNFINKIIKDNMNLINIHYHNMNAATKNSIKNVSNFYVKDKIMYQEKYESFQDHLRNEVYKETENSTVRIFNDFIKKDKQKVEWKKFINDRIPTKILNYVFFFPCYLVLKKSNWLKCLNDPKEELLALTNAGFTHKDKYGNIGLEKTQQSIYGRNVDIIKLVDDIVNGKIEIKIHKEENKENKKENKEEKEIPMIDFIEYKDVIIKGYED